MRQGETPTTAFSGEHEALETLPGVVWEMSPERDRYRFVSSRAPRLSGHDMEAWLTPGFWAAQVHPEDRDDVLAQRHAALRAGAEIALRYRFRHADGHYLWVREGCAAAVDAKGSATLCGTLVDISDSINVSEARQARAMFEARNAQILDAADDAIISISEMGVIESFNRAAEQMFGYSAEEAVGRNVSTLMPEPFRSQHDGYLKAYRDTGHPRVIGHGVIRELTGQRKDGATFPMQLTVSEGHYAGRRMFTGVIRDVSALKQAEAQVARSHAEMQAMLEVIDDLIVRADPQGRLAWWNNALERVSGHTAEALERLPVRELFVEEDRDAVAEHVAMLQAHGRCTLDARIKTGKGGRPFQFSCVARRDANGHVVELIGMGRDLSDLRDKEHQLLQAQKMDVLGHFVDGIAHDFNNILASTLGYSTLCLSKLKDQPDSKLTGYLDEIKKASQRGRDLVTQMLAFGRGSPGDPKVINPAILVKETLTMLRPIMPSSIDIQRDIPADLPNIKIDPVNLHQIVMNLCVNARDAMGSHRGSITVSLARREFWGDSCASCESFFSGDFLEIAVTDTGCGIPPEIVGRLFEPFFSTKDIGKGTGMGLAVVHGIVHERGGHILLDTSPAGTTFRILLPPVVGEGVAHEAEHAADAAEAAASGGETLLVVEDDPIVLHLYSVALQGAGYRVMSFKHPAEALEWISAHPDDPAMLLTDYTMPGRSGARLTEAVHRLRPDLPAVMLTAEGEYLLSDADMARAGVERVYRKPITISGLLEAIRDLLDQHRKESP